MEVTPANLHEPVAENAPSGAPRSGLAAIHDCPFERDWVAQHDLELWHIRPHSCGCGACMARQKGEDQQ